MIDTDDLNETWREILATAADRTAPLSNPRERVARRVERNRRVRVAINATVAFAVVIVIAGTVAFVSNHTSDGSQVRVATTSPPTAPTVPAAVVHVTDAPGGQLLIVLPGYPGERASRQVTLPAGDVRFVIDMEFGGHELRIEGVPSFDVAADFGGTADSTPKTVTTDVSLAPGTYRMYCAVPGHEAAGEFVNLIVQ